MLIQNSSNLYHLFLNVIEATEQEEADYKSRMEQGIGLDSEESGNSESGGEGIDRSGGKETARKRQKLGNGRRTDEAVNNLLTIDAQIKIGRFEEELVIKALRTSKASKLLNAIARKVGVAQGSLGAMSKRYGRTFKGDDLLGGCCASGEGTADNPMKVYIYSRND